MKAAETGTVELLELAWMFLLVDSFVERVGLLPLSEGPSNVEILWSDLSQWAPSKDSPPAPLVAEPVSTHPQPRPQRLSKVAGAPARPAASVGLPAGLRASPSSPLRWLLGLYGPACSRKVKEPSRGSAGRGASGQRHLTSGLLLGRARPQASPIDTLSAPPEGSPAGRPLPFPCVMAQRNLKPKRKLKCCPCLPWPGSDEDGAGEQCIPLESDEEAKLLGHFENSDDHQENFSKVYYQIKEKARKHKKQQKASMNSQNMQLCKDREVTIGLENHSLSKNAPNISNASAFKKNKNSKSKNLGNDIKNGLEFIKPTQDDGFPNQVFSLSSLSLSIMEKKAKGEKIPQKSNRQDQLPDRNFKRVCKSPRLPKRNKNKAEPLCQHFHALLSQTPSLNESNDEQVAHISRDNEDGKALCEWKGINSALCYFEDGILTGFKKRQKPHKRILFREGIGVKTPETNGLQPLLSSSPIALEINTSDSEEEFHTGSLIENRDSPMVKSSTEEMCSSFDHSQDIFLTQRSLLSRHVSDSPSSSSSSPAPKRAKKGSRDLSAKPTHSPNNLPQLSSSGETVLNGETVPENNNLSQDNLKGFEEIRKYSGTKERAVQTEDFFGSSVLATSLLFRREVDLCEKPLDLTLPGRSRSWVGSSENDSCTILAAGDVVHMISQNVSETVSPMEDQTIGSGLATAVLSDDSREKCACNQLRKPDEVKYIQTKLNSSFFFKTKDEPDANIPKESSVKLNNKTNKDSI
ncbi:uncharacterized protein LOC110218923 [Phascolarctos cinereus]|uniref:Uncharacterized protein LOC110218923 n=1 Tax=Phascolarctos cinereus TaxID=38626 RepID=A0A6P5LM67_PHACI|nr:uncharacterized protein LOC110218923 [Phascolarctos cinereus]